MSYRRRNAGVVCHDGLLFVVGGDDGTSNLSNVEVSESVRELFPTIKTHPRQPQTTFSFKHSFPFIHSGLLFKD